MVIVLRVIGVLAILGGILMGENMSGSDEYIRAATAQDWITFFTWASYGIIAGVIFFAFAEILNQSEKQTKLLEKLVGEEEEGEEVI